MQVRGIGSWLLASAITVVFAVTLITLALPTPAEAGAQYCLVYDNSDVAKAVSGGKCTSIGEYYNRPCNEARAACRANPNYEAYKQNTRDGTWKLICGDGLCQNDLVY